jgi:ribose transport system ATP-binding protein
MITEITEIIEDRKSQGLLFLQSIGVNVMLTNLSLISKFGMLDQSTEIAVADDYIKRLRIRSRDCMQAADELSGGNQQKVAIASRLYRDCPIMLYRCQVRYTQLVDRPGTARAC